MQSKEMDAGQLLTWMVKELDYLAYFQDYYGKGENSDEKTHAVVNFIKYVNQMHVSPLALLEKLSQLDTTRGKPEEEQIVFTTIFRTKGLEFDYVVIPQCDENMLPYLKGERIDVYDTKGVIRESQMSSALENERRLFYVAITRARKGVLIGTSNIPSRFLEEIQRSQTESLMETVQELACGNMSARQALLNAAEMGRIPNVALPNLLHGYLPDLGQGDLVRQMQNQAAQAQV
jgi:superfamily I DNA/RNA helicase